MAKLVKIKFGVLIKNEILEAFENSLKFFDKGIIFRIQFRCPMLTLLKLIDIYKQNALFVSQTKPMMYKCNKEQTETLQSNNCQTHSICSAHS